MNEPQLHTDCKNLLKPFIEKEQESPTVCSNFEAILNRFALSKASDLIGVIKLVSKYWNFKEFNK